MLTLLLAIHDHQPVGNLDAVVARAHERCYRPLLQIVAEHPWLRLSLHTTGVLLDWLAEHDPAYLEQLRELVRRGQIEVLGGAYYEPILGILPDRDAFAQLQRMAHACQQRFGVTPRGAWLAERVWEPDLPRVLCQAGLRYTVLDDEQLYGAGVPRRPLHGSFVTDKAGDVLRLFPIDSGLRYRIPFAPVGEVVDYLRARHDEGAEVVTYGDDGEKLGLWRGTYEWVWRDGWMNHFVRALEENASWLQTGHFGEALAQAPRGRVYPPTGSYREMGIWTLAPEHAALVETLHQELERDPRRTDAMSFVRGGWWAQFLAKYPEANVLHKRMLRVSRRVAQAHKLPTHEQATRLLHKGQCNDAYWHGWFGGITLGFLRAALYEALIQADNLVRPHHAATEVSFTDHDADGLGEVVLESEALTAFVKPDAGGSLFELDVHGPAVNLCDLVARRPERGERPDAIHDQGPLWGFQDRVLRLDAVPQAVLAEPVRADLADLAYAAYHATPIAGGVRLQRDGHVRGEPGESVVPVRLEKTYRLERDVLTVGWALTNTGERRLDARFAAELAWTTCSGEDPLVTWDRGEPVTAFGTRTDIDALALRDLRRGLALQHSFHPNADAWFAPVHTASQSDQGPERQFQGVRLVVSFELRLEPRATFHGGIEVRVGPNLAGA